jgi:NAD(P)-dependent dehydrogenase (short-subunit alcohol dehydrogenase family)
MLKTTPEESMEGKFLQGKVAVITGASRGLGRAMALALGESGARLALVGRNRDKLAETRKLAAELGAESEIFLADVRDEAQIARLEKEVIARFAGAHIVVNNAGTAVRKAVADFSLDEWKLVVDTNLTGAFLVSRAFIPHMKKAKWGRIINITSIMAHIGSVGRSAYCASKSGLLGLTKCLALELVGDGVTVVAISPGFYETELTAPLRADAQKNAALMAATPAARWGRPDEIGSLARYICSDATSFMTGTDILMDGGWVAQ